MAAVIATVKGQVKLHVADAEPIVLGMISIPIEVQSVAAVDGSLILKAVPNMREAQEFIQAVFDSKGGN